MALLDLHPGRRLSSALLSLLEVHPAALLGGSRERRQARDFEDQLARMPPHLLDDIGMKPVGHPPSDETLADLSSMSAALRS